MSSRHFKDYLSISAEVVILVVCVIVTHVRPRTSEGITDLLLPQTSFDLAPIVSLRNHCHSDRARVLYLTPSNPKATVLNETQRPCLMLTTVVDNTEHSNKPSHRNDAII